MKYSAEKKCVVNDDGSLIKPTKWTERTGAWSCSLQARYDLGSKQWLSYLEREISKGSKSND